MSAPGFPWGGLVALLVRALLNPTPRRPVLRPPSPATQDRAELLLMAATLQPPKRRACGDPRCLACEAFRRSLS